MGVVWEEVMEDLMDVLLGSRPTFRMNESANFRNEQLVGKHN